MKRKFINNTITSAMADAPSVMIASGWKQDKDGNWIQEPTKETNQLAENLEIISMTPDMPSLVKGLWELGRYGYKLIPRMGRQIKVFGKPFYMKPSALS